MVDKWPLIWKDMHAMGYETWFVEEYGPKGGTFHYRLRGFKDPPVKHYYRPLWMFIDPMMGRQPICAAQFHFENMRQYYETYRNYNKYSLVMLHYLRFVYFTVFFSERILDSVFSILPSQFPSQIPEG